MSRAVDSLRTRAGGHFEFNRDLSPIIDSLKGNSSPGNQPAWIIVEKDFPLLMQVGSSGTMTSEWDPTSF